MEPPGRGMGPEEGTPQRDVEYTYSSRPGSINKPIVKLVLPGSGGSVALTPSRFPPLLARILRKTHRKIRGKRAVAALSLESFYAFFALLDVDEHKDSIQRRLSGTRSRVSLPSLYENAAAVARAARRNAEYEDVLAILEDHLRGQICMLSGVMRSEAPSTPDLTVRLAWDP